MDITALEIISFIKQAGLALSGASCLWGIYFYKKYQSTKEDTKSKVFKRTAYKMTKPLSLGVFLTSLSWVLFEIFYPALVMAHEGISILPAVETIQEAVIKTTPIFIIFLSVYLIGALIHKTRFFHKNIHKFFGVQLVLSAILITFWSWTGSFSPEQIFFGGHGFHSILTLGTVLVLDFIFVLTKYSDVFEKHLYPILPTISKVVWIGLAIDFASVMFVFDQAIAFTPKFMFMQTVIGIIILNGIFLSGPITNKLIKIAKDDKIKEPSPVWDRIITISGTISVASWITVTFTDFLHNISLQYSSLIGIYIAFIAIAYATYEIVEHYKIGSRW